MRLTRRLSVTPTHGFGTLPGNSRGTAYARARSLELLLTTYRTVDDTLTILTRTVPGSSLQLAWQGKVETARRDYLAFAERLGIDLNDAEAILANATCRDGSATS